MGVTGRYLDITQALELDAEDVDYGISSNITAVAVGLNLDYDSRDMPSNAYQGRYLELKALTSFLSETEGDSYQSYHARFRAYHPLKDSLVLAWEVNGCARGGDIPLLAQHFLMLHRGKVGKSIEGFTPAALEALMSYPYPGFGPIDHGWFEVFKPEKGEADAAECPTDNLQTE